MNTSIGAIIQKGEEVILVRGNKRPDIIAYSFPKGHVENKETDIETIHREVYEECGLNSDQYTIHYKIGELDFQEKQDRKIILYYATLNEKNFKDSNIIKLEPTDKNIIEAFWASIDDIFNGKYVIKGRMDELFYLHFKKEKFNK